MVMVGRLERNEFDDLSGRVIGCSINVHRELGPGLLESTYESCLAHELAVSGIDFEKQTPQPVCYKGLQLECGYRLDFLVENRMILEIKSVEAMHPIYAAQLLTYMKLSNIQVGLLINFNVNRLKDGIKRLVL